MEINYNKVVAFREKAGLKWSYSHNLMEERVLLENIMIKFYRFFWFKEFLPPQCVHSLHQLLV